MNEPREMTDDELKRCLDVLDCFRVRTDLDYISLTDGGNSCIMNPDGEFQEFLGYSINSIAIAVAKKLGKPVGWIE